MNEAAALNFDWITPTLAVGGSFPANAIERLARDHRIAAVIDARAQSRDDEALMARHGIAFLHLPTDDTFALVDADLDAGIAFAANHIKAGQRVLIHCEYGIGRSALLALCVLVTHGDAPLDALERMKKARTRISPSPHQFKGWVRWLGRYRIERARPWELPRFEAFAAIAYRHPAHGA